MGEIVKFGVLVGLRLSEVVESVKLLNSVHHGGQPQPYYNSERQTLQHFLSLSRDLSKTDKEGLHFLYHA